ncbi:MAG: sulfotransferase [Hyphomicrobiales bacterium]
MNWRAIADESASFRLEGDLLAERLLLYNCRVGRTGGTRFELMEPRFSDIFIVTYGRTGSTLLQALLNTAPGTDIEGENYGFLYFLFSAHRALRASRAQIAAAGPGTVSHPFYGAARGHRHESEREVLDLARRFLRHGSPASTVCGFKEVRYDLPDLEDYLGFLKSIGARPHFVLLIRNHDDVLASGFMRKAGAVEARSRLAAMEQAFAGFAARNPACTTTADYIDIVAAGPALARLFERLGLSYDENRIAAALAQEHSYDAKSAMLFQGSRLQISSHHALDRQFEFYRIDNPSFEKAGSVIVGGILLPRGGRELEGIYCASPGRDTPLPGTCGLPSPGIAKRYPDVAAAARARFSLEIPAAGGIQVITVSIAGAVIELAKFYPAPDGRNGNLNPIIGQTGGLAL